MSAASKCVGVGILVVSALAGVWGLLRGVAPTPVLSKRRAPCVVEAFHGPPAPASDERDLREESVPLELDPPAQSVELAGQVVHEPVRPCEEREIVYVLLGCSEPMQLFLESAEAQAMDAADVARVGKLIGHAQAFKWPVFLLPGEATWIAERVRRWEESAYLTDKGYTYHRDEQLTPDVLRFLGHARVLDSLSDADVVWLVYGGFPENEIDEDDLEYFEDEFAPYEDLARERLNAIDFEAVRVQVLRVK